MLIHEMTNDECLKALAHLSLGRLACASGGQPYIDRVTGRQASPDRVEAETPLPGKKASRLGSILRRMRVMR
jgi:hypothetical protein